MFSLFLKEEILKYPLNNLKSKNENHQEETEKVEEEEGWWKILLWL